MDIKDQVCSLELAKKLKKLGVEQNSLNWWEKDREEDRGPAYIIRGYRPSFGGISAFTVAELGGFLKGKAIIERYYNVLPGWVLRIALKSKQFEAKTEADARAKMLIYLIESGGISCKP